MINATKEKITSYFQGNSQFVVPFFQRGYVWDEDNWSTLWEHATRVLERHEAGDKKAEHFIGTIITKQRQAEKIGESICDLIDGQQRLTTLAMFLKAIGDATTDQMPNLKTMISENLCFRDARGNFFPRIVPSRYDKAYYDTVLEGNVPSAVGNKDHKLLRAYSFFLHKLKGYSDDRLDLLRLVILNSVPVIAMLLSPDDDEQEIFDTINALGVRLTTGELLKNYIFKDKGIQNQYETLWQDIYERDEEQVEFWHAEKTAGRIIRTNVEVLLYCYLIIKTGSEIKLETLFKEYKSWLKNKTAEDKIAFLKELKGYAEIYHLLPSGTDLNQIGFNEEEKRFFHVVENLVVTTVYPLVLYIYKNVTNLQVRLDMLRLVESYLVRRNVCRLTTKNYNLLFIQIINKLAQSKSQAMQIGLGSIAKIIREFNEPTNLMPTDADFETAFRREAISNQNAREVLFLIALHGVSTGLADIPKLSLASYSVEHMMPTKWEAYWSEKEMNGQQKSDRNQKIKTLGNLTLVTKRLNSAMQNSAWSNKRQHLKIHSSLRMTVDYLDLEKWDEATIDKRALKLASAAVKMWPCVGKEAETISGGNSYS